MKSRRSAQIVATFALLIILGFLLLYFFGFQKNGLNNKLLNSLFISTSAVCVTGLSTIDTAKDLTLTGQIILLALIQLGGLGVITISNWFLLSLKGKLSFTQSQSTTETFGILTRQPVSKLLKKLVLFTVVLESIGIIILFSRFIVDFNILDSLWLAAFHSISAFCNAGFGLFSDSLIFYRHDPIINFTIMGLIIAGGIGFIVEVDLLEVVKARFRKKRLKLSLQSKVVLTTSFILIAFGFLLILILEWFNTMASEPILSRFLESLFLSVTARTAGFNSLDTGQLTNMTLIIVILLMIIGASPGSAGGGIKTTSAAIFWALLSSNLRNRNNVEIYNRTIPYRTVSKAITIIIFYFLTAFISIMILQAVEIGDISHQKSRDIFLEHLFEVISALSTVGLSTGITQKLSSAGQVVIIFCMFVGRIGPLALALSIVGEKKKMHFTYPEEEMLVG